MGHETDIYAENEIMRQEITRFKAERQVIQDAMGNGSDEQIWPSGMPWHEAAAEAISRLRDLCW